MAGSSARLGKGKLSKMRLGADTEYSVFTNKTKKVSNYTNETKN